MKQIYLKSKERFSEIIENINNSGKLEDETKNKLVEVIVAQKRLINNAQSGDLKKGLKVLNQLKRLQKQ